MVRLRLNGASRIFGTTPRVTALKDVDIRLEQGEYVAIEGESGGGKSTMLGILGLLDRLTSGSYTVDDEDVSALSDRASAAARSNLMSFIFQSFHLLDRRSVVENVELPLHYRGVGRAVRRRRAFEALRDVGLIQFAWSRPAVLSGGQRQRVAIARALAAETPVLLADEPTGNLDTENSRAVLALFDKVREAGTTLVVVTHSALVAQHADRHVRVLDGRIASDSGASTVPAESTVDRRPPGRASTVTFKDLVFDAWRNIGSRLGRSLALIAAIAIPLALAVTTLGLAASASVQVSAEFDTVAAREVSVQAAGDDVSATLDLTATEAADTLAGLNGVRSASVLSDIGTHRIRVGMPRPAVDAGVLEVAGEPVHSLRLSVVWADKGEGLSEDGVLVGKYLAENLEIGPVDLEPTLELDGETYVVAGIIQESPRRTDLLGKVLISPAVPERAPVGSVSAYISTRAGAASQVAVEAPLALDPYEPSRFDVTQPPAVSDTRERVEASVTMSLTILTGVALIGAIVSIILATISSVAERRTEIGLRRALGARRMHISSMLIVESVLIGAAGGVAGVALGMASILVVTLSRHWTPVFDTRLAFVSVCGGVLIATVGAVAGAIRAGSVLPNAALRS